MRGFATTKSNWCLGCIEHLRLVRMWRSLVNVDKFSSHIVVARQNMIVLSVAYLELHWCTLWCSCLCGTCYHMKLVTQLVSCTTYWQPVYDSFVTSLRLICDFIATHLRLICDSFMTCLQLVSNFIATCFTTCLWLICNL